MAPEEGDMRGYSTKLDWHGGPDHGRWVELLKDGVRVAYMSLDEWKSLGATEQAVEDDAIDRVGRGVSRLAAVSKIAPH
jgi:hypothetical protein